MTLRPKIARHRRSPLRVLVVVDDACTSPNICAGLRARTGDGPIEALVIAPARGSVTTQWYSDEEAAHAEATQRLRTCVACLRNAGVRSAGQLADPDLVQAIDDALRVFAADRVMIVTAPQRASRWLRPSAIDRARARFPQPIEHLVAETPVRRGS